MIHSSLHRPDAESQEAAYGTFGSEFNLQLETQK